MIKENVETAALGQIPIDVEEKIKHAVVEKLKLELKMDKSFTGHARHLLGRNLTSLVERMFIENTREMYDERMKLYNDLSPIVVGSELLHYKNIETAFPNKHEIVENACEKLIEIAQNNKIIISHNVMKMSVENNLNRRFFETINTTKD